MTFEKYERMWVTAISYIIDTTKDKTYMIHTSDINNGNPFLANLFYTKLNAAFVEVSRLYTIKQIVHRLIRWLRTNHVHFINKSQLNMNSSTVRD